MGRYYSGDIEGKFWFGVQDSNDAEYFGVEGTEPSFIEYYFEESNMPDILAGIKQCKEALGDYEEKLDAFFDNCGSYNDKTLSEYLGIEERECKKLLTQYARLELGIKIRDCVLAEGSCSFEAEL